MFQFPDVGATLDFEKEQGIHERMFSGEDLKDPATGAFIPGVIGISFSKLTALEAWHVAKDDDTNPEVQSCLYEVEILFDRGQAQSQIHVRGQIRFHVVSRMAVVGGESQVYFQMSGQDDLTTVGEKNTDSSVWGHLKCLYR